LEERKELNVDLDDGGWREHRQRTEELKDQREERKRSAKRKGARTEIGKKHQNLI